MKKLSRSCVFMAVASIWNLAYAVPPTDSPYYTDVQTQYPKDKAQDTFQMASFLACFMSAMAPEKSVGVGEYLALIDQNKCEDNGSTANSSGTSGSSSVTPPDYAKVLVSVTEASTGELNIEAKVKLTDIDSGVSVPKNILAKAVVRSGPNITPPYGDWSMDFCSSTAGNAGSCNDGLGLVRVNGSGVSVYNSNGPSNYRAGRSVFTTTGGVNGYGKVSVNEPQWYSFADKIFAFGPGIYSLKDRLTGNTSCMNPSTNSDGVKFNQWDTYLYDRSTGQRIAYQNPGFQLKSNLSGYVVGSVDYWGVNFWREAGTADQLPDAVLIRNDDPSQTFRLRKTPGRLNRVTTSSSTGLSAIDGVPLNFNVWGWGGNRSIGTKELLQILGFNTSSSNLNLLGYWSAESGTLNFTGYQECAKNCVITNFEASKSFDDLVNLGINNFNAWVNGVNISYNFNLQRWENNTWAASSPSTVKLIKQKSEIVMPTDSSIPNLVCVGGYCPSVDGGNQLIDTPQLMNWPAVSSDISYLSWDAVDGGPKVFARGNTAFANPKLVDWRSSGNGYYGHYYQLYDKNDLDAGKMSCNRWTGNGWVADGYCPEKVRDLDNSVYYTWQTGNQWDAYNYLIYRTGGPVGSAVQVGKPINLSYQVAAAKGTLPSYVGKIITLQSPRPGTLWLPGNCVDSNFEEAQCSSQTDYVNTISVPFASNESGSVTLLDDNGQQTSTKYYVKWLQRGVYFERLPNASCTPITQSVSLGESLELPGLSEFNPAVKSIPWPSTGFDGIPRVIDGQLQ